VRSTRNWSGGATRCQSRLAGLAIAIGSSLCLAAPAAAAPTQITLTLSPPIIAANGVSTSTAIVRLTDAGGGVAGETVTVTTDGGQPISAVADEGAGNYAATITSTTTPGVSTITAQDTGTPSLTKTATLTQHGPAASVSVDPPAPVVADGTATTQVTAHVTDGPSGTGNPVPNESVTFSPLARFGSVTDNGDGSYTSTYTSTTTAGTVPISANDGALSGQSSVTQIPGPAASVVVHPSASSIIADGVSTIDLTATVTDAHGNVRAGDTVTFAPSSHFSSPTGITGSDGTFTATYRSSTATIPVSVTATDGSISGPATVNQTRFGSVTSLSAPPNAVTNQSVNLVASVVPTGGNSAPTGKVTFFNGFTPIPGCIDLSVSSPQNTLLAQATCPQTSFAASTTPLILTASFKSNSLQIADSSDSASLSVGPAPTTTSLDVSNPTVAVGFTATYTAHVTPSNSGPTALTGSVAFTDGGTPIAGCGAQPVAGGVATCTVRYSIAGSHSIAAHYSGDANFRSSSSPIQPVTVRALPPRVHGTIKAIMQWTFFFTPRFTAIRNFVINGAPIGANVRVTCHGRGCPFARHDIAITRPKPCHSTRTRKCHAPRAGTLDLLNRFQHLRHRRLSVGTQVVIMITRRQWIGKYYSFKVRKAHAPAVRIDCLAPGGSKPGVGC
jgi:adhesin/invasin